jgi:nicotinate-nucleotide--dimethylbenzimidazole phosphoribosyltransferase
MNQHNDWIDRPAATLDGAARQAAVERQAQLTKPPGALGRLEDVVLRLAAMQGRTKPSLARVRICVFAADHGVAVEGVSAFPQSVTAQMVANMAAGGAAISVLAEQLGAGLELVDLGTVAPVPTRPASPGHVIGAVLGAAIGPGTANLAREPAMSPEQLDLALAAGRDAVSRAIATGVDLFIGGEMGIGNTTSASALACALLGQPASALVGPGTGLDAAGVDGKQAVIEQALALHGAHIADPRSALRRLGGFEIAALAGAYVACAQRRVPVLVDGFISSVAALAATRLCAGVGDWMFLAHASAEPGHRIVVQALDQQPLLDLGLRLGEGSGAAAALPLLRLACALHAEMATFAEAGVADG